MDPGEKRRQRPRMVPAAIAVRSRAIGCEPGNDIEVAFERSEWLEQFAEFVTCAICLRRPRRHVLAIGHIDERHAVWGRAFCSGAGRPTREAAHCFQPRQGEQRAESSQGGTTGKWLKNRHRVWQ
jgi:hypothetical protein